MALKALFYPDVPFETLFIPWIYKEVYLEKIYDPILLGHEEEKDLVILDIGANIGATVQYFRKFAKKVYAVEPSPLHFEALLKNKEFNKWDNVDLTQAAITAANGTARIHYNPKNYTTNSVIQDFGAESFDVPCFTMDTFIKDRNIEKVDFMKLDIEEAEEMVIKSPGFKDVADRIKCIVVEIHSSLWKNLVDYMVRELGFTYHPDRQGVADNVVMLTRE